MGAVQCSNHTDCLPAVGRAFPDAYWDVTRCLNWIDELKVLLPIETQWLISAAPMQIDSLVAVDWDDLILASEQAWSWLFIELIGAARAEGYHQFLERQRPEVRFKFSRSVDLDRAQH